MAAGSLAGGRILHSRRVETEAHAVDRLQVDLGIGFEIFSEFCDKHVHASTQEIVVLAPDIQQDLFPLEDAVGMFAKEFEQVRLFLSEVKDFLADGQLEVGIGKVKLADGKRDALVGMHFLCSPKEDLHAHQ